MDSNQRRATVSRKTTETNVSVHIDLNGGDGSYKINTSVPFLDHMLQQIVRHGLIDLTIDATGDIDIDDHHVVEDVGICLGQAFNKALGSKVGITRYGHAYAPLDEALSRVVIDLSGRPGLFYDAEYTRSHVGKFDVDLVREFFMGFVNNAMITLHIDILKGINSHHQIESLFKAFALALSKAVSINPKQKTIPSSKGSL